jgi:hypothetical protein
MQNLGENKDINGLYYFSNVINDAGDFVEMIDKEPWASVMDKKKRCVQYHDLSCRNSPGLSTFSGEFIEKMYSLALICGNILSEIGIYSDTLDQCVINDYSPYQGIRRHIDSNSSGCYIKFQKNDVVKKICVEPNSLYIMTGDSRYKWSHEIDCLSKYRRISVTFRTLCG